MSIKIRTQKEYERLMRLEQERITVGVHDAEGSVEHPNGENGETVAEIAQDHEFGYGVPQRSWLRAWVDSTDFKPLIQNLTLDGLSRTLSARLEESITERIRSGQIPPPNSPGTAARKGHDRTLIDTETFVNSVKAKVSK